MIAQEVVGFSFDQVTMNIDGGKMIKILGVVVFGLIGIFAVAIGVLKNEPVAWQMGGGIIALIILMIILVKAFPRFFEGEDSAKDGMNVINSVVKRGVGKVDD